MRIYLYSAVSIRDYYAFFLKIQDFGMRNPAKPRKTEAAEKFFRHGLKGNKTGRAQPRIAIEQFVLRMASL
jgi:hypothetical protein